MFTKFSVLVYVSLTNQVFISLVREKLKSGKKIDLEKMREREREKERNRAKKNWMFEKQSLSREPASFFSLDEN